MILQPYDVRDGRRHLPPGHHAARARPPSPGAPPMCSPRRRPTRRPLRREPQPAAALLPVPGDHEAEPGGRAGAAAGQLPRDRPRPAAARYPLRRGRLGKPDARAPGAWAGRSGATAWRSASSPISSRSAASPSTLPELRDDLRPRAAGDVCAGRRERLRPRFQRRAASRYGDVFLRAEREYSAYNFEHADTDDAVPPFRGRRARMRARCWSAELALPAYDQCIKASHLFNLLDARGVISVTERASYIGRVRDAGEGLLRGLARPGEREAAADARASARTVQRGNPRAHAGAGGRGS